MAMEVAQLKSDVKAPETDERSLNNPYRSTECACNHLSHTVGGLSTQDQEIKLTPQVTKRIPDRIELQLKIMRRNHLS